MSAVRTTAALAVVLALARPSAGQAPRANAVFPNGGKAGTETEVEIRGANLAGASTLLVTGRGVSGTVSPGGGQIDERGKPIWQAKCGACHELRSPANRSMSPAQWAATVQRMVKVRQAPLSADESEKVSAFLVSSARAGKLMARVRVAPDTPPGLAELRVGTPSGVSSAVLFETGALPEVLSASSTLQQPQDVTLPCVVNGSIEAAGVRHCLRFRATAGQRLVFDLAGYRLSETSQMFFNPALRLLDAQGAELAINTGYHLLDPLLDWTCKSDGAYILEVRDILGRGNPSSVYRLRMGALPYDTVAFPPCGAAGQSATFQVAGRNVASPGATFSAQLPEAPGLAWIGSPAGAQRVLATPYPIVAAPDAAKAPLAQAPACLAGRFARAGQPVEFPIRGEGAFEVTVYAERIRSAADTEVTVVDAAGNAIGATRGDNRFQVTLAKGVEYTVRAREVGGNADLALVFAVEIAPLRPGLEVVARPAEVALRKGSAVAIQTLLTRRENVAGDITVSAEGLPAGVTCDPVVIQPDRYDAWLVLRAAPDAPEGPASFRIVATATGAGGETRVTVTPQEYARLGNEDRFLDRWSPALAVGGDPAFSLRFADADPVLVHPKKGVEVKAAVERRPGFQGIVYARLLGLPYGWVTDVQAVQPGQDSVTLLVRPDGGATEHFIKRDPSFTPITCRIEAWADDFHFVYDAKLVRAQVVVDEPK